MSSPTVDPYEELENISSELEGYKINDSVHEPMEYAIAHDVVSALKDFPTDEQQRVLRKFSAEARRWAATNLLFRDEIELAIQLIDSWLANLAAYETYREEVVEPVRRAMALDYFDYDDR